MADFKDFIKGFATTALANKGFDFRGMLDNKDKKPKNLDPNIEKARKLVDLGEKPFGTHTYTYEKDGKFYGSGFEDEDIELSSGDMARMYDEYIKSKEDKNEPKKPMKTQSEDFKKEIEKMRANFKRKYPSAFGK